MRSSSILATCAALVPLAGSLAPPPRRASLQPARGAPAPHLRPARRRCGPLRVLGTDEQEAIKEAKADKYKQALMEEWSSAWEQEGEKEGLDWEFEKMRRKLEDVRSRRPVV